MKKLLLIPFLFVIQICFAQSHFPGEDVDLLLNKEIRVLEKAPSLQKFGYDDFFLDEEMKKKYECCESYNSKYSSLAGKTFRVTKISPYTNSIGTEKYKLQLVNEETGTLFFDYSSEYEHSFPFEVVGGLDFPEGFFCKKITTEEDKFTGEVRSRTPYLGGILLMEVKKDGDSYVYLSVKQNGATPNVGKKGLILLLENGQKIERPEANIDVEVGSANSYVYSAFIELTPMEIDKLLQNKITDNRLYIYDGTVDEESAATIQEYLRCLVK